MDYIEGEELRRARMLVNEINDFMLSISNEVNGKRAYKGYLNEKLDGLMRDINCLGSITGIIK